MIIVLIPPVIEQQPSNITGRFQVQKQGRKGTPGSN
jgi:hypothetical protein